MDKKINPDDYQSYRIVAPGWSLTVYTLKEALWHYQSMQAGRQLYGIRHNGKETLLRNQ